MLRCRNTITSAFVCGLIVACVCAQALRAHDPIPEPMKNGTEFGSPHEEALQLSGHIWPQNRQVLPNPFEPGIDRVSFTAVESPGPGQDNDGPSAGTTRDPIAAETESSLEARVRALEAKGDAVSDDNVSQEDEVLRSRLSFLEETLGDFEADGADFLEALSRNSKRLFNGRIHLDTWQVPRSSPGINAIESGDFGTDPKNRILVRRARIGIRGTVPPDNMSYRLELEFSGTDGGQIRDAWLGWDELPALNTLRVGNQKRPYGLDHLNSSNSMTFLERPYVVDAMNQDNRRIGLASYGASSDQSRNWQFGIFNMVTIQDNNQIVGDKAQMELAGRLANTGWYDDRSGGRGYAHFGLAGSLAFPDGFGSDNQAAFSSRPEARTESFWLDTGSIVGAQSYQLLATESVINIGAFQFVGEWMRIRMQREFGFGSDLSFSGGYLSLSYFLTGEHIPWNRKLGIQGRVDPYEDFFCVEGSDGERGKGLGAWQLAMRLSKADFSDGDIRGGDGESLTLALNWYWNAHTRLQFNYLFGQIDNRRTTLTNGMTPVVSGNYQIMGTRFMIDF